MTSSIQMKMGKGESQLNSRGWELKTITYKIEAQGWRLEHGKMPIAFSLLHICFESSIDSIVDCLFTIFTLSRME